MELTLKIFSLSKALSQINLRCDSICQFDTVNELNPGCGDYASESDGGVEQCPDVMLLGCMTKDPACSIIAILR